MIITSTVLLIFIGLIHSYLGERYILTRLLKRDLPKLFGSDWFTKQVLRFAWHLTTIAWFGFAAILLAVNLQSNQLSIQILFITSCVFALSGAMSFGFTKGRHYSYVVFWAVSSLCALAGVNS